MIKILAISGSLRSSSSNTTILRASIEFAPEHTNISIYEGIGSLPHFNPELDDGTVLDRVEDWRDRLKETDTIIFCTPEYAHGVPGVLKNALDWIVSSGEFMHKPTAVISASPSLDGGAKANTSLVLGGVNPGTISGRVGSWELGVGSWELGVGSWER